jgi:hypothetical protein
MENEREEGEESEIRNFIKQLERQRDELQVKISLAKLEAREEWGKLEKKWEQLKANAPQMRDELGTTASGVGEALKKSVGELREGYARLRKLL